MKKSSRTNSSNKVLIEIFSVILFAIALVAAISFSRARTNTKGSLGSPPMAALATPQSNLVPLIDQVPTPRVGELIPLPFSGKLSGYKLRRAENAPSISQQEAEQVLYNFLGGGEKNS